YGLKPEIGRQDGNKGLILQRDDKGAYQAFRPSGKGLFIEGQVRDAVVLSNRKTGKDKLLIARNNDIVLSVSLQQ
ncbi:MAG: hypothetical protein HKN76_00230, partial [Saprospiraceae bacterium]|nr:hypothetical protein [Saprospiraceae bacterium]